MGSLVCPECGAELMEDVGECLIDTNDGGVIMDAFPAYICGNHCGFLLREEALPRAIAQQDKDRLLLLYPNMQGRILDVHDSVIWPPMHVDALLGRGYWEDYIGNHDVEELLKQVRDSRSAFLEPPNIFQFATSELSQDAFLCWLMSWGEEAYSDVDRSIHEVAVAFLEEIFFLHNTPAPRIETVHIERQFKSLDILAVINGTYAILIEDKTFTKNHSNQLERYKEAVSEEFPELIQLPIYYKIADQSNYRSIESADYVPFKRQQMLAVLKKGIDDGVQNAIFQDYYHHLQQLEDRVNAFRTEPVEKWDDFAWQGFYQEIQKEIDGDWGYVSNRSGGFWGFWWSGEHLDKCYLQLEQDRLCVKIRVEEDENKREVREVAVKRILSNSKKHGLQLQRPTRLGNGKTMTIAERKDYLRLDEDGFIDIERTVAELKRY
ncbi:PD-(D/E)XK nuclease family protein [Ornithinibacillus salinisoli]|uniref:PD-(D/E)XK nuclease family protein n=1 Tax=Ornithinibacillus salinisoli TaxID=1848459 RepID=A0ABW4W245_9BACI